MLEFFENFLEFLRKKSLVSSDCFGLTLYGQNGREIFVEKGRNGKKVFEIFRIYEFLEKFP